MRNINTHSLLKRPFSKQDPGYVDRVLGCLFGGAVGDAFGYEVEFSSLSTIRSAFGARGITAPVFHDGKLIVSDDTQMTLFTLEGLMRALFQDMDQANEEIRLAYIDWLSTQAFMGSGWNPTGDLCREVLLCEDRAPGLTCISALQAVGWGTLENPINNSKGCGGVMRVAPIGLIEMLSPEQAFEIAARAAAITHGHPGGYWSAGAMAGMTRSMLEGTELFDAAEQALQFLANHSDARQTFRAIEMALAAYSNPNADSVLDVMSLGEGWIGEEALAIALYAALRGETFPEVFSIGANHSGDSDSTASIAGQLYGACNGLADLPEDWVRCLDVYDPMARLIETFLQAR